MNEREGQVSLFSFDNLYVVLYCGLPLFAYVAGSITYSYFDLEGFNVIPILSVFPTFPEFYEFTMANYGTEAGKRFFVIALFLMVVFLIQTVMTVYLAFLGADLNRPRPAPELKNVAALLVMLAASYSLLFVPAVTMDQTSRMAQAVYHTDIKFFLFAGTFWFFIIALNLVLTLFFRMIFSLIQMVTDWRLGRGR